MAGLLSSPYGVNVKRYCIEAQAYLIATLLDGVIVGNALQALLRKRIARQSACCGGKRLSAHMALIGLMLLQQYSPMAVTRQF